MPAFQDDPGNDLASYLYGYTGENNYPDYLKRKSSKELRGDPSQYLDTTQRMRDAALAEYYTGAGRGSKPIGNMLLPDAGQGGPTADQIRTYMLIKALRSKR